MPTKKRVSFVVSFDLPVGCSIAHARHTLESHVKYMGGDKRPPGSYGEDDPGDPMFDLDRESISVIQNRKQ
jgi:hypothetical protein